MEEYVNDWESCDYCKTICYEFDTGYAEYGCSYFTGNAKDHECLGGCIESGCPLSFKYKIEQQIGK